ncbi:MAG TPA: trigger factor [Chloroflexi bacterium]|nr:trigger factor [Chloroflexota bacterium]
MKVTTQALENRRLRVIVEMDEEQTQKAMRRTARHISKQVKIPGFRKGKAPYDVVIRRFGEDVVRQEAVEKLAEQVFKDALEQEEIVPYAPGALEEIDYDPVTYTFTISLPPEVDLGDYRDYRRDYPAVKVHDAELQETLEDIREEYVILEFVERPAELGDEVIIDADILTLAGEPLASESELSLVMDPQRSGQLPGIVEALVGMAPEEERTFNLTLPDDFQDAAMQGEEVTIIVEMLAVYERTLPDIDDDLARTTGNYETLEALKEYLREDLLEDAQKRSEHQYTEQVLEDIYEMATVEFPPEALEEELDQAVTETEKRIKREMRLSLDDFLRIQNLTLEELREEMKPQVTQQLKRALMLGKVVYQEGLHVSSEEIEVRIEEMSAQYKSRTEQVRAKLQTEEEREKIRNKLYTEKAIDRLVAIAKGEAPPLEPVEDQTAAQEDEGEESNE